MRNAGLSSSLFLDELQRGLACSDDAQGRLVTLSQRWQRRDATSTDTLWRSYIKTALGNLGFVVNDSPLSRGFYPLYEDYGSTNCIALLYVVPPGATLDDESVGRFWPAKLIAGLRDRKLTWGILTDGAKWRLYSTKSAKPFEDHVELNLADTLEKSGETTAEASPSPLQKGRGPGRGGPHGCLSPTLLSNYALFERFFHAESFTPRERDDYETDKVARLKALGLKARKQNQAAAEPSDDESGETPENAPAASDRAAGIYLCRLDLDGEISEAILEARVKEPLLEQVDNVLRFICNGFIADTRHAGVHYTEDERREVFESSVKLLYRCLFLFYAESRNRLPSEDRHAAIYAPHSINALCREARKFRWNERTDTIGYDLWQQLKGLVQAVNEGDASYGVMGYNGGLFDDEQERFLGQHRLRNDFLAPALYWLAFVDPGSGEPDTEYPIPYADLEIRHLGEMYEAILEYKVRLADTDYIRRRTKKGSQTIPSAGQKPQDGDVRIKAGDIFFGETALERKQSGSYYTPESLVRFLVGKAVIAPLRAKWESGYRDRFNAYLKQTREGYDDAARRGALRSAEELVTQFVQKEVLTYKVCDLAMGSGHFLVAAANLMADFVVELLAGIEPLSGVPSGNTGAPNHWRRLITRYCLYGADLNPLAVNLAKLGLWLNCFARDHKLTFLDHHLRCGNTLIGLRDFAALRAIPERRKDTGRDRKEAESAQEELPLYLDRDLKSRLASAGSAIAAILGMAEDDTDKQREAFDEASQELQTAFAAIADLHTAYLMDGCLRPLVYVELLSHFARGGGDDELSGDLKDAWQRVRRLRKRHHFFHWPLEFPDVFGGGSGQGFSATVGNPPWDIVKPNTLEFFTEFDADFRSYKKDAAIEAADRLKTNPAIKERWEEYEKLFVEQSDYFTEPSAVATLGKGDINTYKLFLNQFFQLLRPAGRMGIVVPSGLYSDPGCQPLRELFFRNSSIQIIFGFENRWPVVFPAVDNRFKFVVFVTERGGATTKFGAAFMQHGPARLPAIEVNAFVLDASDIEAASEGTLAISEANDVAGMVVAGKMRTFPNLASGWRLSVARLIDKTNDIELFAPPSETTVPVFEDAQVWFFDCEFAPIEINVPASKAKRYSDDKLVSASRKRGFLECKPTDTFRPEKSWWEEPRLVFREVAAATNERTCICAMLPPRCLHTYSLRSIERFFLTGSRPSQITIVEKWTFPQLLAFLAAFNSLTFDYVVRLKGTNHLSTAYAEMPLPKEVHSAAYLWPLVARALRLTCTTKEFSNLWAEIFPRIPKAAFSGPASSYGPAHELELRERLAESVGDLTATWTPACGMHDRTPERRDTGDRAQTRAEIDALVAHLYGLTKTEFAYILDTFPGMRNKEMKAFGEYQSRRKTLEEYDRFAS